MPTPNVYCLTEEEYYTKWYDNKNELVKIKAKTYDEFKQETQALNKSLDYRIINYEHGNYAIKDRVTFLDAVTDVLGKVKDALKNTTISVGVAGSGYKKKQSIIQFGK